MQLICNQVSLIDKTRVVFENLSVAFPSGQISALYGPTGSGKTSLLLILGGYMKPTSGQVLVGQLDVRKQPKQIRKSTGLTIIHEFNPLLSNLTVQENIKFQCRIHKVSTRHMNQVLERFDLLDKADTRIEQLTQPETFRTGLAMAMVHDPGLILIDEPGHAMTSEEAAASWHYISGLIDLGKTVVLSTQSLELARNCGFYLELPRGKAVYTNGLTPVSLLGTETSCAK